MKVVTSISRICLTAAIAGVFGLTAFAQTENPPVKVDETKAEVKPTETPTPAPTPVPVATPEVKPSTDSVDDIVPYYNNYLKEYRLGPNDVITVEVFGQCPDYCKTGITVPPTARISYPLIREGVMVGGKTVEQIADEITKKLDEYIIDPKVTVTLDKAMSVRYSVMGKVAAPGIRIMDRKVSIYEAIIEAGGITKEGDKKKVAIISFDGQGRLTRRDINLAAMETGKEPLVFLNPGDQVFVGGKGITFDKVFDTIGKLSVVRLLFGSPF